jgi:cell division septum initiation protein DivIVA
MAKVVVELGARTAGLTNGLKTLGAGINNVMGTLRRFAPQLTAILGAGALGRLTKQSLDAADATAKMAQSAGQAVDAFSKLSYAGKLASVSQEQLVTSSRYLAEWLEKNGQGGRDLTEAMIEMADEFARMPDGPEKVQKAYDRFGRAGQQLIPLLNQGSEAIREQMQEAEKFGAVVGPRFARNSQQFNDNLTRIGTLFRGMFNLIADALLPAWIEWQENFLSWVKETDAHLKVVDTMIGIYKSLAFHVLSVATAFKWAAGFAGTFSGAIAGGMSVSQALEMASRQADAILQDYTAKAARIESLGRQPEEAASRGGSAADPHRVMSPAGNTMLASMANQRAAIIGESDPEFELERLQGIEENAHRERLRKIEELQEAEDNARMLREEAELLHQQRLMQLDQQELERRKDINKQRLAATVSMLSAGAEAAKLWGKKGFAVWKAFALGQAVVNTALAVTNELAQGDIYSKAFRAAAVGVLGAVQIASIAAQGAQGFATGGIIPGGEQFIRVNERGTEGVVNAFGMQQIGAAGLEMINRGLVTATTLADAVPGAIAGNIPGDMAFNPEAGGPGGGGENITVIVVDSRDRGVELFNSLAGRKALVDAIIDSKTDIGLPT